MSAEFTPHRAGAHFAVRKRGARSPRLPPRRLRQHLSAGGRAHPDNAAMDRGTWTPQSAHPLQLGADGPRRDLRATSLPRSASPCPDERCDAGARSRSRCVIGGCSDLCASPPVRAVPTAPTPLAPCSPRSHLRVALRMVIRCGSCRGPMAHRLAAARLAAVPCG